MTKHTKKKDFNKLELLNSQKSILGDPWVPIYETSVDFDGHHFESAMSNIIRQPNINSTVILRADILKENTYNPSEGDRFFVSKSIGKLPDIPLSDQSDTTILHRYLEDANLREIPLENSEIQLSPKVEIVRRIIPRNPFKDHIINQTCAILSNSEAMLVVYIPHIVSKNEIPFYLPPVYGVALLYHKNKLSIHYLPFSKGDDLEDLRKIDASERSSRIALRLLQTSTKHSDGVKAGYEKRVNHDLVVPKIAFQNRYISLKKKYSSDLVNSWCESTDPKKHVFEDLAIAAFLIELWAKKYGNKEFEFRDLGCGNGLLVYILNQEGYKGKGIDARARKSWSIYPPEVRENLLEQIIIPGVLLKPHPALRSITPEMKDNGRYFEVADVAEVSDKSKTGKEVVPVVKYFSSGNLLTSPQICTTDDFPHNTFIIGNHSDELTCWIPLLNHPFMVIPCCSHALSGAKVRYSPKKRVPGVSQNISSYSTLVEHVEDLAVQMGWKVEKEMLRIPSTRNAAIIGFEKENYCKSMSEDSYQGRILDIIAMEGGSEGWVENSMVLMKKPPRNH